MSFLGMDIWVFAIALSLVWSAGWSFFRFVFMLVRKKI